MNSFHVRTYQCLHFSVFTIASVPDIVFIKNAGEEATWEFSKLYTSIGARVTCRSDAALDISHRSPIVSALLDAERNSRRSRLLAARG